MNTMKTFLLMAAMTALFMVAGQAMGGQQVLKNAAFERLHGGPKQGRVQLRQLQQNGVRAPLYGGRVGGGQGRGLGRGSSSGGISHGRAAKAAKKKPKPAMMPALGCLRG